MPFDNPPQGRCRMWKFYWTRGVGLMTRIAG
jgi:hypothetical protein